MDSFIWCKNSVSPGMSSLVISRDKMADGPCLGTDFSGFALDFAPRNVPVSPVIPDVKGIGLKLANLPTGRGLGRGEGEEDDEEDEDPDEILMGRVG